MNAISPILIDAGSPSGWEAATRAVNLWRGETIHWFSRGEAAVSETLLSLAGVPKSETPVRLRQLSGQRSEDLHAALLPGGVCTKIRDRAVAALDAFRNQQTMRSVLCHGTTKVWLDRNDRWAVTVELLDFSKGREERTRRFFTQRDAELLLKDLRTRCRELEAALAGVRASTAAGLCAT